MNPLLFGIEVPGWLAGLPWNLIVIPITTAIIGYYTNWLGIKMLFYPIDLYGIRVPGLQKLANLLPRKIQQIPGIREGVIGWQGIIPSKAEKMGSIAVDKGITKLGNEREFYEQLDPDAISEHILATAEEDIHEVTEEVVRQHYGQTWESLPPGVREEIHDRVEAQLPIIIEEVTDNIGEHIDDMLDVKLMVVNHLKENPRLVNRIFTEVGDRELNFLINMGFWMGLVTGIFINIPLYLAFPHSWWTLPSSAFVGGVISNWVALKMIFRPYEEHRIGPFRIQGLFIKRQPDVSAAYSSIIADDIITMAHVGENLLYGKQSDRTRQMIQRAVNPVLESTLGRASVAVEYGGGSQKYDAIRSAAATEGIDYAEQTLQDDEFSQERADAMKDLLTERMQELPPTDYTMTLRSAFKEDEWLVEWVIGGLVGMGSGVVQLALVFALSAT